jgi:hypothetical protein
MLFSKTVRWLNVWTATEAGRTLLNQNAQNSYVTSQGRSAESCLSLRERAIVRFGHWTEPIDLTIHAASRAAYRVACPGIL